MGLPDQGEEARLHGKRWLECGGDSGAVSGGLHVLEASLRPHADLRGVGPWALAPAWPVETHFELPCLWLCRVVEKSEERKGGRGRGQLSSFGVGFLMIPLCSVD